MAVKKLIGKIEYKDNLVGQVWLVRIKFDEAVYFSPGQYVSVKVTELGERRSYSVASSPLGATGEAVNYIDILIDVSPMGVGSRFFLAALAGDEVEILGFMGRFMIEESLGEDDQLLFVATGTGIAPVKPMIEELLRNKKFEGKVVLVWGMRSENDLYWMEEIERLQRDFANFKFELVLSRPDDSWPGNKGHVGDVIEKLDWDWKRVRAYLCGDPGMVEETGAKIVGKGVDEKKVIHEKYA